ncbi:MAG: GHKL domain-containing protein [Lachnospiraceae bacterium]|nr:GHKL domain-containing protein [Lachnospiraceae bacterium]
MKLSDFIIPFINFIILLPATLLCVAPAKNHLRFKVSKVVLRISVTSVIVSTVLSTISVLLRIDYSLLYLPAFVIIFVVYHRSLDVHISQSVFIFLLACAFMTFISDFIIMIDAFHHPDGKLIDFSATASIIHFITSILFCTLASFPASRHGAFLIDNLLQPKVWWIVSVIAGIFFAFTSSVIIHDYSTLHYNKVGMAYIAIMLMMFLLLIMLCIVLYFIVDVMIKKAETDDRNHILEMQEKQFESEQRYIDAERKARHDFRQTIYTLKELSTEHDYEAIDEYLSSYIAYLPQKETVDYCHDHALNALFNHYSQLAAYYDTSFNLEVSLPDKLNIETADLCSVIGNILENAILACNDIPSDDRFIHMVVSEEQGRELYIAAANSYDGNVKENNDRYLSTHKGGNGIGLISIAATASKYNGMARFRHDNAIFYSDVMFRLT